MPKIGPYTLHAIEAGRFGLDGGAMFGIIPKPLWERRISADERNRIPLNMRCLLLEHSGRLILIDNGLGNKFSEKFAELYAVNDTVLNLGASMRRTGFAVSDVTDVILSHLHFDHCGGSTTRIGDQLSVTFPNAMHHVQSAHWDWANTTNVREKGSFLSENFAPLQASGQLNLLSGRHELFPGIEVIPVDGHTKEMQLIKISDGPETIVFVADLLPTHAHLSPAWNMAYDLWPMTTIKEKAEFLEEAITGKWKLFFEHDPEVAVADVEMSERGPSIVNPRSLSEL